MRKVLIIAYLVLCGPFIVVCSQATSDPNLRTLKFWQIKGMAKSAMRLDDHYQARDYLLEWHRRDPGNHKIAIKLANYLLTARDYEHADLLFSKISRDYPDKYPEAVFYHAQIQKIKGNYEEALPLLQKLRNRHRKLGGSGITRFRLDHEIAGCHLGIASRDTMVRTLVTRFDESINSPHIEFGPILLGESTFLYGSARIDSTRLIALGTPYSATRQFYEARKLQDRWQGGFAPKPPFTNLPGFDTGRGVFSLDRKRFYSVHCHLDHRGKNLCQLHVSHLADSIWTPPVKLDKRVNLPNFNSTQPAVGTCFSNLLEIIYFVSDRPGGAGGLDIWFTVYDKQSQQYRKAENAGVFINTAQDEITPFFDLPTHRLYFSSDGWATLGGSDIFFAKGDMTTWESPVNIGVPGNSSYDDLNFVQNYSGKFGLFASNRPGSLSLHHQACCDDLYAFSETESPRVLVTGRLVREDIVEESGIFTSRDEDAPVLSKNPDLLSNQPVSILLVNDSTSSVLLQEIQTNAQGEFEIWVEPGMDYIMTLEDSTLVHTDYAFSTRNAMEDETMDVSTISLPSVNDKPIVIGNIYYQFGQTDLSVNASQALDTTLIVLLNRYPAIRVEILSHTDNIGEADYNLGLSVRRAKEVVRYLISKGIKPDRLSAKGLGESMPLFSNTRADGSDDPAGREKNRRTEFKITGLSDQSTKRQ